MNPEHLAALHNKRIENTGDKVVKDCLSCRIWGGFAHIGIAAFVASHYKEMSTKTSRGFILAFSAGKQPLCKYE